MRRKDFGLADLFGASYDGAVDARMQNSYLQLERSHGKRTRCWRAWRMPSASSTACRACIRRRTTRIPNPPLTLIPSYPDLPMEEVYPRVPKTDIPEVFVREVGKGRVVYFPWDIDRTFWEVLSVDHGKLLRNAVDWAANEPRPVTVDGSGRARCDGLAAEGVDDGAPGESDEPDDDEGSDPRVHSDAAAEGRDPAAAGRRRRRCSCWSAARSPQVQEANGVADADDPVDRGSRGRGGRFVGWVPGGITIRTPMEKPLMIRCSTPTYSTECPSVYVACNM